MASSRKDRVVSLTRSAHFSAAHRLHSPHLSDAENRDIYGKCNHVNGHGHNYLCKFTLRGPVDERTGMVYDMAKWKRHIADVLEKVDHRNLDVDVPFFRDRPSTTENLCIYLWEELRAKLGGENETLQLKVDVQETPNNSFTYDGSTL